MDGSMVIINNVTNMFWGITIDAGKRYSQTVNDGFHLSMAALENGSGSANDFVQIMIQHESSEFLLCTLQHGKLLQQPLDLVFSAGEEISFSLNGKGTVHLTGYLLGDEPEMEEEEEDSDAPDLIDTTDDSILASKKRKALALLSKSKKMKMMSPDDDDEEEDDDDEDDDDLEDEFSEDDLSFDDDDDDDDEEEEEDEEEEDDDEMASMTTSPAQKQTPKNKTPAKSASDSAVDGKPGKEKKKTTPGKTGTPNAGKQQQITETPVSTNKKNKQQQQTPSTTPSTPENGDSSKKKKKNKKKKKKSNDESMNESNSSTPGSTPKSESKPKVEVMPKKKVVAGGTVVEDTKVGHGPEAKPGKMVSVYYAGTLAKNNKRFDSCTDGKPFRFRLCQGEVIKGWDNGINGMKVGGKRKITVPANQAYGNVRQGPIPPNSSLVFEVELKAVS